MAATPKTAKDLHERTYQFAVRAVRLVQALPPNTAGWVLGRQVARSGTSVGSNVEEAKGAQSRADFIHKMSIALKEARETLYWLRLIRDAELVKPQRLATLITECDELVRILTAIVKKSRERR